ncbi:MAG: hydrogenase maturation protease [Clostridia bacterium]|nr:hydrogenase maturation protease [Clostridia bacterium]
MSAVMGVVGCGNRLRGDDGVALEVLEALRPVLPPHVLVVDADGLAPWQWLDTIVGLKKAVIIDAAYLGKRPGAISRWRWNREIKREWPKSLGLGGSHGQGLWDALVQAEYAGYALPLIVVFAIEIDPDHTGWGQGISGPVRAAIAEVAAKVVKELQTCDLEE